MTRSEVAEMLITALVLGFLWLGHMADEDARRNRPLPPPPAP